MAVRNEENNAYFRKGRKKVIEMKKWEYIAVALLLMGATSCVTKKKYLLAENGRLSALQREAELKQQLSDSRDENDQLNALLMQLKKDTISLRQNIRNYKDLLSANMGEQDKLNELLTKKMQELEEREATINQLQDMMNTLNEKVQRILTGVKEALMGFSSDELSVREENGKIYVAMSDKLLFQSGSATVDKRGKEALAKLASVLNQQKDVDVNIEGHTDTKPIHTARFADNWDLSVIRATSVVRILTSEYNVSPLQIVPSGRGEYLPVADNADADGRSKNRRTEIIIAPKMDELLKIINN